MLSKWSIFFFFCNWHTFFKSYYLLTHYCLAISTNLDMPGTDLCIVSNACITQTGSIISYNALLGWWLSVKHASQSLCQSALSFYYVLGQVAPFIFRHISKSGTRDLTSVCKASLVLWELFLWARLKERTWYLAWEILHREIHKAEIICSGGRRGESHVQLEPQIISTWTQSQSNYRK